MYKCPHCATNRVGIICNKCNKITSLIKKNAFEVFNLEPNFKIDIQEIEDKLFDMQMIYHPDRYINCTTLEQEIALNNSSIVNDSYTQIKHPMRRAELLFHIDNINIQDTAIDPTILMKSLENQEELEELNDIGRITQKLKDNDILIDQYMEDLTQSFDKKLYGLAKNIYIELKFANQLKQNINKKLDSLI